MYIEVTNDSNEVIFEGLAEDFLEANDYDEEIREFLCNLDAKKIGSIDYYYGNFGEEFKFEKIEDEREDG